MGIVGTPLGAVGYKPVWKQEARNEHGGKRLHGAFTGGFSAGYFNTVGSKEGWAPSSFTSSKNQKDESTLKDVPMQSAEMYMDEEDMRESEEAVVITLSKTYEHAGGTVEDIGTRILRSLGIFQDGVQRFDRKNLILLSRSANHQEEKPINCSSFTFEPLSVALNASIAVSVPEDFVPTGLGRFHATNPPPATNAPQAKAQSVQTRAAALGEKRPVARFGALDAMEDEDSRGELSRTQATQALAGFMPFVNLPEKHEAYIQFLQFFSGAATSRPRISSAWQSEFIQSALIFKPLPSVMSLRFTSSKAVLHAAPDTAGLQFPTPVSAAAKTALPDAAETAARPTVAEPPARDPKPTATRKESEWLPSELLCKRFDVERPFVGEKSAAPMALTAAPASSPAPATDACLEMKRPDIDVFRDIFAAAAPAVPVPKKLNRPSAADFW